MPKLSTSINIGSIQFLEQAAAPSTPASGYARLYTDNSGRMRYVDDAGTAYILVRQQFATVNTTDATQTTVATIACANNVTTAIEAVVIGRRTGGGSGSAEDAAFYRIDGVFKASGGTATEIGESKTAIGESQAGWDVDMAASSGNALIRVTGAASNNVTWDCYYTVRTLS